MENAKGSPQKVVVSWIELILLALLVLSGMGIWTFTEQQVNIWVKPQEPHEDIFQKQNGVLVQQAELAQSQSELATLQAQFIEQRLHRVKQSFKVDALLAEYPELRDIKTQTRGKALVAKDVIQTFVDAKIDLETTGRVKEALESEVDQRTRNVADRSAILAEAQRTAKSELNLALERFGWNRRLIALKWAGGAIALFFAIAFVLVSALGTNEPFKVNRPGVFGGSLLVLSVLIGYQIIGVMGAAALGTLILIVILIFASRKARREH